MTLGYEPYIWQIRLDTKCLSVALVAGSAF